MVAPTGSGKTECSVIPIFARLGASRGRGRIRALYVTPLRALNRDVFGRIAAYAAAEGLSMEIRHGDTTQRARRRIAESPPDVLITTPESLVVLLSQERMLAALSELEWVVVDEVHELLASERGAQLSLSMERLALNSARDMTRVGLSATVGNVREAAKFVAGTKRKCRIVRDASVRRYDVEVRLVDGSVSDVASEAAEYAAAHSPDSPVLLFANSRGEAELVASVLKEKSAVPVELHHGSLSREVREEAEGSLKEGRRGIVVCTSSLELGMDISSVELVIHYGSPRQVSKLVQRIGRSRHRRGASARGLVITNSADDELEARAIMERVAAGSMEEQRVHEGAMDVLAHHLVGLSMQLGGDVSVEAALGLARAAYPFRNVRLGDLLGVLELLDSTYVVTLDRDAMTFCRKRGSFRYHFENLSTIPDILRFRVFDSVGKRHIGTLDQRFVGDHGEQGNVFVLRGSQWRIMSVDEKALAVNVEPFRSGGVTVPYWEGENIPVDAATAGLVGALRRRDARRGRPAAAGGGEQGEGMPAGAAPAVPDDRTIVAESSRTEGAVVLHACLGTRINATLSALLSSMLSSVLGFSVESRSDAYRIALVSRSRITEPLLRGVLSDSYDLPSMVSASLAGTHNINWRTWCVCKKFGIVERGAVYERRSARFLHERYAGTPVADEAIRELFHDKYDLDGASEALSRIRAGEIALEWREADGRLSEMAAPVLDHAARYYSSPANVDRGIMEMVRKRLRKTVHRLVCARCGGWERSCTTDEASGLRLACPHCRGRQIAATFYSDHDLAALVRRRRSGKKVSAEERRRLDRAWKTASLVGSFGATAILVLSGYGVGADTAARILRNMVDEETLLKQIYEAERQYVMTKGFWDN